MPKVTWYHKPVNHLAGLLTAYKKSTGLNNEDLALKLGVTRAAVSKQLNKAPGKWRIEELQSYCKALGIPPEEAALAAIKK